MRGWAIGVAAIVLIAVAALLLWRSPGAEPAAPMSDVVVVKAATSPAAAPAPPPVARTVAAAPDAFVGEWRSPPGARMAIVRADDRYQVELTVDGASENYDGVLQNGRVQIARGVDGEWIQVLAGSGTPCLQVGATQRFCRG